MSADGQARILGCRDLGDHLRVVAGDARKIHHLAQTNDVRPAQGFRHVLCRQLGARRLKARRARHAAWNLDIDIDRQALRFVVHQPNTGQPKHIGDLVRIDGTSSWCRAE